MYFDEVSTATWTFPNGSEIYYIPFTPPVDPDLEMDEGL